MYKMISLQTNAPKVALAGLLAASLCGGSMMVGASTAYAGDVTISKTATETDANALSYNAFKLSMPRTTPMEAFRISPGQTTILRAQFWASLLQTTLLTLAPPLRLPLNGSQAK